MKRTTLVILSLLTLVSSNAYAQDQMHEISLFAGTGSLQDIAESFADIFPTIISLGYIREETEMVTPVLGLNYRYHHNKIVSVGVTFNYQQFENKFYLLDLDLFTTDVRYYTFMGRVDFTYLRRNIFQMYSGVGLGISHQNESGEDIESYNKTHFAYQANLVGLRLGKEVAGFLELGFGCNGIVAAGIAYQF